MAKAYHGEEMSDAEQILLKSGLTPEDTAARLADVLHARIVRHDNGEIAVRRPTAVDPTRSIGGEVVENDYGEIDPRPGEESIYDYYDLVLELWVNGRSDEDLLHSESQRIFDEIVAKLPWPAAHIDVGGLLHSAWAPGRGRADFPPGTGYSARSRDLWEPYANM
jgi:hypothetical protein